MDISTWLNCADNGRSLLRVLSALDIAICSSADRPAFCTLIRQLPAFGQYDDGVQQYEVKHIGNYVQWLTNRGVRVKVLLLADRLTDMSAIPAGAVLLHVETIGSYLLPSAVLEPMLRLCPGLTEIDVGCLMGPPVNALAPKLRSIRISERLSNWPIDSLAAVCPQLQELKVINCGFMDDIIPRIGDAFPLLQVLEIQTVSAVGIMVLLTKCKCLRELYLLASMHAEQVEAIGRIPQLKRLTLLVTAATVAENCSMFATMLELREDLEYLQMGRFVYSSEDCEADLQVECDGLDTLMMTRILNARCSVHSLELCGNTCIGEYVARVIAERVAGQLHSLTLSCFRGSRSAVEMILSACGPSLRHLSACGFASSDELLLFIASVPQLLALTSLTLSSPAVTDVGMVAALQCLPYLSTLEVYHTSSITVKTLQAIVDRKLRLKTLKLLNCEGISKGDGQWFLQRLKERQLLPVVSFVWR